jgi:hypothetical protein
MTVAPLSLAWLLLLPLAAGVALLRGLGLRARDDRLAFVGWAWLAGTLALTLLLFAWSWFALPAPRAAATALLILGALAAEFAARRAPPPSSPPLPERPRAPRWEEALFVAALLLCLLVTFDRIVCANATIVCLGDESTIWASKGRLFFFAGGMNDDFVRLLHEQRVAHSDYPPMNPLLQWWTFLHAGAAVTVENRLPLQCTAAALLLAAAGALRRNLRPSLAAALLLLVALSKGMAWCSWAADSEPLVAMGMVVAVDGWLRFDASGRRGHFALMACGLATALWAKNEGALLAAAFGVALASAAWLSQATRARLLALRGALAWLALPLACEAAHRAFNLRFGLVNDLAGDARGSFLVHLAARLDLASLRTLSDAFARTLLVPGLLPARFTVPDSPWLAPSDQNLLFPAFVVALLAAPRRAFRSGLGVVASALVLGVAGFALVYLATVHDLAWHLETSVGRVLFNVAPAAAVALAAWLAELTRRAPDRIARSAAPATAAAAG